MTQIQAQLPDKYINRARFLLESGEVYQWELGDLIEEGVQEIVRVRTSTFAGYSRANLIRELATGTGADESTLRDRHSMARAFPPEIRVKYQPLTYSQLRACRYAGERMYEYAELACAGLWSVRKIRYEVSSNGHADPIWIARWDRVLELAAQIAGDSEAPGWVRAACRVLSQTSASKEYVHPG